MCSRITTKILHIQTLKLTPFPWIKIVEEILTNKLLLLLYFAKAEDFIP
jgi:hypothetical protein